MELKFGEYYPPAEVDGDEIMRLYSGLIGQAAKYGIENGIESEDAFQMCSEAFWRAYINFDPCYGDGKKKSFISYVKAAMRNALTDCILHSERKSRLFDGTKVKIQSLYYATPINNYSEIEVNDFNGEDYSYNISDKKDVFEDQNLKRVELDSFLNATIVQLDLKHRQVMELHLSGYTQKEIGKRLNLTQPRVHELLKEARANCRRIMVRITDINI